MLIEKDKNFWKHYGLAVLAVAFGSFITMSANYDNAHMDFQFDIWILVVLIGAAGVLLLAFLVGLMLGSLENKSIEGIDKEGIKNDNN